MNDPSPALLEINSHWHEISRPWAQEVGGDWYCHCPSCEYKGEVTSLIDAMNQAIVHHYKCKNS